MDREKLGYLCAVLSKNIIQMTYHLQPAGIVDEAHPLDKEMLEKVRLLLNFKMDAQSPVALILLSRNELWQRLKLQSYAAIR